MNKSINDKINNSNIKTRYKYNDLIITVVINSVDKIISLSKKKKRKKLKKRVLVYMYIYRVLNKCTWLNYIIFYRKSRIFFLLNFFLLLMLLSLDLT